MYHLTIKHTQAEGTHVMKQVVFAPDRYPVLQHAKALVKEKGLHMQDVNIYISERKFWYNKEDE